MDGFLDLPQFDSSMHIAELEADCVAELEADHIVELEADVPSIKPRNTLASIDTSPVLPRIDDSDTEDLLKSATVAVADALGVDANNLPEPFYGLSRAHNESSSTINPSPREITRPIGGLTQFRQPSRQASQGSISIYSPPIDQADWGQTVTDSLQRRLSMAVADVLGLDTRALPRDESFVELGGTQRKAKELRANCAAAGMSVRTKDIMNCRTIAELETCVTPLTPVQTAETHGISSIVSPLDLSSPESASYSPSIRASRRPPTIPPKAAARRNSVTQLPRKVSRTNHNDPEHLLSLHSDVSRACVLKPRAGFFEESVVALLTLSSCIIEGPDDCEIKLQNAYYTSHLPAIRRSIESRVSPEVVPSVWIVLEKMPIDEQGNNNRRKLQTWIQNANEELSRQIRSIESRPNMKEPVTPLERRLSRAISKVLDVDTRNVGMGMSFTGLGGDQSTARQLSTRCLSQGISVSPDDVMQASSLTQLAILATTGKTHSRKPSEQTTEVFDLSPMQRLYFHTPMGNESGSLNKADAPIRGDCRFNQSILMRLKQSVGVEDVRAAVEAVVGRHSMLRSRFEHSNGSWCQCIIPDISTSYHFEHHSVGTNAEVESFIESAQLSIHIEEGPVFAAHHFHTLDGYQMLYLVAHHLVVDLKSWQVIADDLEGLLMHGHLVSGRSASFKEWTLHQRHRVQNDESISNLPFEIPVQSWDYWGMKGSSNTYGDTAATGFTLGKDVTSMLEARNKELRTDSCEIFMAALLLSFSQTFQDRQTPAIWNQEHERTALEADRDISETVGWFTSLCPLAVDVFPTDDIFTVLGRVKDSRRATVEKGLPYFTANLLEGDTADSFASEYCPLELIFTYAGEMQNLKSQESLLEQIPVPGRSLGSKTSDIGRYVGRIAVFEVSILVDQGEAKFKFLFNRASEHQERIQEWIRNYEKLLRQSINKLQHYSPGLALSDVPHLDVSFEGLGQLNKDILPGLNLSMANIEAIYPVTPNQQNVLINQTLIPGSSNAQMIFEMNTVGTSIDIGRICAAWQQVTEKHPAMRTVFAPSVSRSGLYDQIVLRTHSPSMLFLESESLQNSMAAIDNLPPLPLTEGIPWHRLIVSQAVGKTHLKLEVSQAICDMGSLVILFNELEQAYFDGEAPATSEAAYTDYFECLKAIPCSVDHWRERLQDTRSCQFPSLVSKSAGKSQWQSSSVDLQISSRRLDNFAREQKMDMSTVLRAAWGLLLKTYVGSDDVLFGCRVSGRDMPVRGLGSAVGPFSSVLACRLRLPADVSLKQLLWDAEDERLNALQHQHSSLDSIQHELKIKGDRLFNTCLSFGYQDISDFADCKHAKFRHTNSRQATEYDIHADVNFYGGNITLDIGYRILSSEQAITVSYAFGRALETVLEGPSSEIRLMDLFSVHDHKQILAWNSMPQANIPQDHVHQLITTQAFRNPDIEAVCAHDGGFTYSELHKFTMILAKHLLASGLKPQTPVPVIVQKGRWAIVAMLAVLAAGAIIVPLDAEAHSTFPWVIDTVNPEMILVSDDVKRYVAASGRKVVAVNDQTISAMSAQAVEMTTPRTNHHDIACILFPSGSSKSHKAISYSHGALATACAGQGPTLRINPSSRVMQLSSYSVDIAISEVFTTLVSGGCVCVPSGAERLSDFTTAAKRMKVNWTYLTPTLSRKLDPQSLSDLAIVCFRTRQLDTDTYAPWAGKAKVLLVYGSAEACPLGLSAAEVTDPSVAQSFGNPFCGNFWIVSSEDNNRLMPVGALGELVIGGPTLATGLEMDHQDVKTWVGKSSARAKSLLEQSGARLLKTGHMVRYREHGQIEFVTADSEECEINGKAFRVTDVEPKLRRCLGRVDVIVETIAFNHPDSPPILAAFVELGDKFFNGKEHLTKLSKMTKEKLYLSKKMADIALRETLPAHMVPTAYIPVRRMPLTPSLKVNRKELQRLIAGLSREQLLALAQVANPNEVQSAGLKPLPLTQGEQQMRLIWAEVLGIGEDSIMANDGFLSLGGDNLTSKNLVVACRQRGIAISIADVLRNASLTELCRGSAGLKTPLINNEEDEVELGGPVISEALTGEEPVPKFRSDRSMIEDVAEASTLQTMAVESGQASYFMINISGALDWKKLQNSTALLVQAHAILRTAFVSHSRQVYQTVLRAYNPEFIRYQCQNWRLAMLASKLVKREQSLPVDFRRPVTKFYFLDAGKSSVLIMRLSKAHYDDLSIPVLVRDLGRFYRRDRLSRKPASGFCDVVRASQSAGMSSASEAYWREFLKGASMTQIVAQPTLASLNTQPKIVRQQIPTGSLQSMGIPFETILKGAWSIVLSNLSGENDVVFGQLVDGRNLMLPSGQTVSGIVGPQGNVVPVRCRIPDIPITFYDFFRALQGQYVTSFPHEMQADIIKNCTSWPAWTRFSSVVHHSLTDKNLPDLTIGNASAKVDLIEVKQQSHWDILISTSMIGTDIVDISLTYCEKIQPNFAEEVLKMLSSTIALTSSFVMEPMILKGLNDNCAIPRIPLPAPEREPTMASSVQTVDPDQARAVHNIITAAWDSVLGAQVLQGSDIRSVPFYEIWGALTPAVELARFYTQKVPRMPGLEDSTYTMEEIVQNATMMQQYELIIAKQQTPSSSSGPILRHSRSLMMMTRNTSISVSTLGKNIRKLTIGTGGTPQPSNMIPSSCLPPRTPSSCGTTSVSLESLTEGDSNSDEDELKEGDNTRMGMGTGVQMPYVEKEKEKRPSSPLVNKLHLAGVVKGKGHKKASSFLGKMIPNVSH
ncbi:hypothetical protein F5Y15DRAFT_367766 [Xylariaceae sp. FL0016]|nr:hypothetical protein F5Y15DRAFT_367766 [Xylariaceae sp. FL0016]